MCYCKLPTIKHLIAIYFAAILQKFKVNIFNNFPVKNNYCFNEYFFLFNYY